MVNTLLCGEIFEKKSSQWWTCGYRFSLEIPLGGLRRPLLPGIIIRTKGKEQREQNNWIFPLRYVDFSSGSGT